MNTAIVLIKLEKIIMSKFVLLIIFSISLSLLNAQYVNPNEDVYERFQKHIIEATKWNNMVFLYDFGCIGNKMDTIAGGINYDGISYKLLKNVFKQNKSIEYFDLVSMDIQKEKIVYIFHHLESSTIYPKYFTIKGGILLGKYTYTYELNEEIWYFKNVKVD